MSFAKMCLPLVVVGLLSAQARADDPPLKKPGAQAALEHLSKATKLYKVRSFEEAAAEYKAGAVIEPAAIFDYNLGQCYRQLHRYDDAIWHYQQFISSSPQTPEHIAAAQKFIDEMRAEKAQKAMTEPPVEPADAGSPPVTVRPLGVSVAPTPPPRTEIVHKPSAGTDWFGVGMVATGGALAIVGGGFLWNAHDINDRANSTPNQSNANSLHDQADRRQLIGAGFLIGGGLVVAGGVLKLALTGDSKRPTVSVSVTDNGFAVCGLF